MDAEKHAPAADADQEQLAAALWEERVCELLVFAQAGSGNACADLRRMHWDVVASIIPVKNNRMREEMVRKVLLLAANQLNGVANSENLRARLTVIAAKVYRKYHRSKSTTWTQPRIWRVVGGVMQWVVGDVTGKVDHRGRDYGHALSCPTVIDLGPRAKLSPEKKAELSPENAGAVFSN